MNEKVMSMSEAISKFVKPGYTLFVAGARNGEPTAAVHEIVRQNIEHLTLIGCLIQTACLLIAQGLLDKILTGWMLLDEKQSYATAKAKSINRMPVLEEYSHFGICLTLLAGEMGIPFIPTRAQVGSDMMKYNPNIKKIRCPFTGENIGVVKAITPDVGIIHVQRCDAKGNAQKWGSLGADPQGINASSSVIVTTEKIIDSDIIRREPNLTIIPGFRVGAVVEQPWGGYPGFLSGCYNSDYFDFVLELATKEGLEGYIKDFVFGVHNWDEYLEKRKRVKGKDYFDKLKIQNPILSEPITTGY